MVNQKEVLPHLKDKYSLGYYSALAVTFCGVMFFYWTVGTNVATIFDIPWVHFSNATIYSSPLLLVSALLIARHFSEIYCEGLNTNNITANLPNIKQIMVLVVAGSVIMSADDYTIKYSAVAISLIAIFLFSRKENNSSIKNLIENYSNKKHDFFLLLLITIPVLSVVLFAHRPDLDDSSFIQIATQTLAHKDLAPLSFDASLGYVLESFRFAPYRISSYETLIAFASDISGVSIYNVYYLILPAFTAILTILTTFIFSRWFFPSNKLAIAATAIFVLIMLAWGETHIAYGNRVFVRLFQGKGLIIALTTPFSIIVGMVLANRPSFFTACVLVVANICAIGVSSSGLVMTIFTSIIIFVLATSRGLIKMARTWVFVAGAMIYPVMLALWLNFSNVSSVSMSDVGTYLPINASMGMSLHESILLVSLLFGFSLFILSRNKSYVFIIIAVFTFILNPLFSELMSFLTSRNMSWRLAWAAPIPLLFSIAIVASFGVSTQVKTLAVSRRITLAGIKIASITLLLAFIFSDKWVSNSENKVVWGYPSAKLPGEFYVASQIAEKIQTLNISGQVLAYHKIAAWLPLTLPGVKLVMPGHTYPTQLETILPSQEFQRRMYLYNAINKGASNPAEFLRYLDELHVDLIIIPSSNEANLLKLISDSTDHNLSIEKIGLFSKYSLYKISRRY